MPEYKVTMLCEHLAFVGVRWINLSNKQNFWKDRKKYMQANYHCYRILVMYLGYDKEKDRIELERRRKEAF